jgi:hypothetical protein
MHDLGSSIHLRASDVAPVLAWLRGTGRCGAVIAPQDGWVSFVADYDELHETEVFFSHNPGEAIEYWFDADYGWGFRLWSGAVEAACFAEEWSPTVQRATLRGADTLRNFLSELPGEGVRFIAELARVADQPFTDAWTAEGRARRVADLLRLPMPRVGSWIDALADGSARLCPRCELWSLHSRRCFACDHPIRHEDETAETERADARLLQIEGWLTSLVSEGALGVAPEATEPLAEKMFIWLQSRPIAPGAAEIGEWLAGQQEVRQLSGSDDDWRRRWAIVA